MKRAILTVALLLMGGPLSAQKESRIRLPVRTDSRLWLQGSSNVRDWTCKATSMEALIDVESSDPERYTPAAMSRSVRAVFVKVPVRSLKCGDRHMEANMYTALKAPAPPAQSFITAEFDRVPTTAENQMVEVNGRMEVAGVERAVLMTVKSDRLADGTRRATGSVPILMTDFGIKPPRPWMGILRTADKVVVQFEIFIAPQTAPSSKTDGGQIAGDS